MHRNIYRIKIVVICFTFVIILFTNVGFAKVEHWTSLTKYTGESAGIVLETLRNKFTSLHEVFKHPKYPLYTGIMAAVQLTECDPNCDMYLEETGLPVMYVCDISDSIITIELRQNKDGMFKHITIDVLHDELDIETEYRTEESVLSFLRECRLKYRTYNAEDILAADTYISDFK